MSDSSEAASVWSVLEVSVKILSKPELTNKESKGVGLFCQQIISRHNMCGYMILFKNFAVVHNHLKEQFFGWLPETRARGDMSQEEAKRVSRHGPGPT